MLHVETIAALRSACDRARAERGRVGLVPTMGYLHRGHRSLMEAARAATDFVVVTIFVNPLQFAPGEDLARYPRDLEGDLAECRTAQVDCVFSPPEAEMYPRPSKTTVHVSHLTEGMCGAARPAHFDGVTTVVAKLFSIVGPCDAFFGRKDAQQLAVVARMTEDLNLPVRVVGCPLVREPDGLALSSRNAYLGTEERAAAPVLFRALRAAADAVHAGEREAACLAQLVRDMVATEPLVELEYADVRDAAELTPVTVLGRDSDALLAVAARVGTTRLIDNVGITIRDGCVRLDLGR